MSYLHITFGVIALGVLALLLFGHAQQAGVVGFGAFIIIGGYNCIKKILEQNQKNSTQNQSNKNSSSGTSSNKPRLASQPKNVKSPTRSVKSSSATAHKPTRTTWKSPPRR